MSSISPSSSASNGSFVDVEGLVPPQFPGVAGVDREVALKYLDAYQAYLAIVGGSASSAVSARSRNRPGKKQRAAARRVGDVPVLTRSQLTYTQPERRQFVLRTPTAMSAEPLRGLSDSDTGCYLYCIKFEFREVAFGQLGEGPTFGRLLDAPADWFVTLGELTALKMSKYAGGVYGMASQGPSVAHTMAAIVAAGEHVVQVGSFATVVRGLVYPAELTGKCPRVNDVFARALPVCGAAGSDLSLAPSSSASRVMSTAAVPAIVRVGSRESLASYTSPSLREDYMSLVVGDAMRGPGYCYSAMILPEFREAECARLGPDPSFLSLLLIEREKLLPDENLARLQVSRVSAGKYHVVTGTVMPSVVSTFEAVAAKVSLPRTDPTLYGWAVSRMARAELLGCAPDLADTLGSGWTSSGYYYDARDRPPVSYSVTPTSVRTIAYDDPYSGFYSHGDPYRSTVSYSGARVIVAPEPPPEPARSGGRRRRRHRSRERDRESRSTPVYQNDPGPSRSAYTPEQVVREVWRASLDSPARPSTPVQGSRASYASPTSSAMSRRSVKVVGSLQGIVCAICTDAIAEGAGFLSCGHVFHSQCVDRWFDQADTCPTCRANQ